MKAESIIDMYKKYIQNIECQQIMNIMYSGNMLYRHNIMNRILIDTQKINDEEYTDVRTEEEWYILGRGVIDNKKAIKIVSSIKNSVYTDKNGNSINKGELSYSEINEAIEFGIITKDSTEVAIEVERGYDISNTYEIYSGMYINNICPTLFDINIVCLKEIGIEFSTNETKNNKSIHIRKDVISAIDTISNEIAIRIKVKDINMAKYSISSMLGIKTYYDGKCDEDDMIKTYDIVKKIKDTHIKNIGYTNQVKLDSSKIREYKNIISFIQSNRIHSRINCLD